MGLVEQFLTPQQEQAIIDAIHTAEDLTSGEIRVHLEGHTDLKPIDRATEVFYFLGMDKTAESNGVLIYVAVQDHHFAIIGDKNINSLVGQDFWDATKNRIQEHFKAGRFADGLIAGVTEAGRALAQYFPIKQDDRDELPNTISKGE